MRYVLALVLALATASVAAQEKKMERVDGIGGVFFRATSPKTLAKWYADHLGVGPTDSSAESWQQAAGGWQWVSGSWVEAQQSGVELLPPPPAPRPEAAPPLAPGQAYEPGCWVDPGPYGCLGSGPGYALGAKLARPERDVLLLLGDGAFGFSGLEFDTLVRHGVPVVGVMGNNGIWALEKHPMEFLYGYSVAADLRPETPYHEVVEALGGHGELVRTPAELRPALERAFASGRPALVNVLTDPTIAYPRRSTLA